MSLSPDQLANLKHFNVLCSIKTGEQSIILLGKRPTVFSHYDVCDAEDVVRELLSRLGLREAKDDQLVQASRCKLKDEIAAIFSNAGIPSIYMEEIENEYWPEAYVKAKYQSPWFLVTTPVGHFKIGWRKRVLVIDWDRTTLSKDGAVVFENEDTTKDRRMIHAWSYEKATEYIRQLVG